MTMSENAKASILVIEDEEAVRELQKTVLEAAGYQVFVASDGVEGSKAFRAHPTDLVITDLVMPEQDGIQIIVELRREFPELKIIAISGGGVGSAADYLEMAGMLGAKKTLNKPILPRDLVAAVEDVLGA